MNDNTPHKNRTRKGLLLAALAIACLLLAFGIGTFAGGRAARKAVQNIPDTTIKEAGVSADGDLIITLSTGKTINAGHVLGAPGRDGVDGKNGQDGAPGANGADGKDGADGAPGAPGADGRNGLNGANGADGKDGRDGADGSAGPAGPAGTNGTDGKDGVGVSSVTISASQELIITYTDGTAHNAGSVKAEKGDTGAIGATGAAGADGTGISTVAVNDAGELVLTLTDGSVLNVGRVVGRDGQNGADGKDGADGQDGKDGRDGADGQDGKDGENGQDGKDGKDGQNGADGIGVSSVAISDDGSLTMTLSNGNNIELGNIRGKDGAPGANGADGKDGQDGADGRGIESASINEAGELVFTFTDGSTTNLGTVVGKDGKDGEDGADGQPGKDGKNGNNGSNGKDGVGIELIQRINDELIVVLTPDYRPVNLGNIKGDKGDTGDTGRGITDVTVNGDGNLIITYTDGTTQNAGHIVDKNTPTDPYAIGSVVTMGKYEQDNNTSNGPEPIEWIVVQNTGNKALLMSKYVLEYMAMSDSRYMRSAVREFLEGNFYWNAFTYDETKKILDSHIPDLSAVTQGRINNHVYIFSYDEITALSLNNIDLTPIFTPYVLARNGNREDDGVWLRDEYDGSGKSGGGNCIYRTYQGFLHIQSPTAFTVNYVMKPEESCGVRPSMWISIEP